MQGLCVVVASLAVFINVCAETAEPFALDVDDECGADGSHEQEQHCALSALQRAGAARSKATREAEETGGNASWQKHRETGTACYSSCDPATLGPAECHHFRCICKAGHVWSSEASRCVSHTSAEANRDTGGRCRFWFNYCHKSRGFTKCVGGQCVCYKGYEAKNGKCSLVGIAGGNYKDDGVCQTPQWGDPCWKSVSWAMADGIFADPENYPGLRAGASSFEEFQTLLHRVDPTSCPKPCPLDPPYESYSVPSMRDPKQSIMKGVAYSPMPMKQSVQINGDDFMSEKAGALYADWGRGDLKIMKEMGANTVRMYGNDANTSHRAFLDEAHKHGLRVIAGMSKFGFTQGPDNCLINDWYCYRQTYFYFHKQLQMGFTIGDGKQYHPALKAMIICNEPALDLHGDKKRHLTCRAMASVFDAMIQAEKDLGITGNPIAFTITWAFADFENTGMPGLASMLEFYECLKQGTEKAPTLYEAKNDLVKAFHERWVNSFNTQNVWYEVQYQFLDKYASSPFWSHDLKIPVFIGEYHNIDRPDTQDLKKLLGLTKSKKYPFFLGFNFFEYTRAKWKPAGPDGTNVQWDFGLFDYGDCPLLDMDYLGNTWTVWNLVPAKDHKGRDLLQQLLYAYGQSRVPKALEHSHQTCKASTKGVLR